MQIERKRFVASEISDVGVDGAKVVALSAASNSPNDNLVHLESILDDTTVTQARDYSKSR